MFQISADNPADQAITVPDWVESVIASPAWRLGRLTSAAVASVTIKGSLRDRNRRGQLLKMAEALAEQYDLEVLVDFANGNGFTLRFTAARW